MKRGSYTVYIYVFMYMCMYTYIYICIYICVYMYVCMYACMYVCTYVCIVVSCYLNDVFYFFVYSGGSFGSNHATQPWLHGTRQLVEAAGAWALVGVCDQIWGKPLAFTCIDI